MRLKRVGLAVLLLSVGVVPQAVGGVVEGRDPLRDLQWGLDMIRVDGAWNYSTGRGVTIAVVDSGVDLDHPDLKNKIVKGRDFYAEQQGDQDKPGPRDETFHGTHVAGIAAAETSNGTGIAGVAPKAALLPVRVCYYGCNATAIAKGIRYAVRRGSDVINLSLGSVVPRELDIIGGTDGVEAAVRFAVRRGVVVVAAAGNAALPICSHPASSKGVLCVGSVNRYGISSSYSNHDVAMRSIFLVAPGGESIGGSATTIGCEEEIVSTYLPSAPETGCSRENNHYYFLSGTSMAAPHVAGVAALLVAQGLDRDQVVKVLVRSAVDIGQEGRDPLYGHGLVDALAAVKHAARLSK